MTTDPKDSGIAASFLQLYLDDRRQGVARSLMEYLRRFPGHEAVVAREFLALEGGEDEGGDSVETPVGLLERLAAGGARDRYRDAELVGRGGMGEVYRVWDRDLERTVAMKVLAEPWQGLSARRVRRFVDEMRVTSRLSHPGIVPVHDLGLDAQDRLYFTMPLIAGESLRDVLARVGSPRAWSLARVVGLLVRVTQAVAFAHSRGVVHRDLKPANIMVGPFGESYVLDWGVARIASGLVDESRPVSADGEDPGAPDVSAGRGGGERRTLAGDVLGTPAYMAPEQAEGSLSVGPGADIYALGAILYHALAGRPPYSGGADALDAVRAGPPPALASRTRRAPAALISVCERAMARDVAARYPSAEELADDLQAFLDERIVRAHRSGSWARAWSWVRRHRAIAAATVLVVVMAAVAFAMTLRERSIAEERARVARKSLAMARKSIGEMLGHVASAELVNAPAMDAARRAMLEEAVVLTRELRQIAGNDPEIVGEVALSHLRLGTLDFQLGALDDAAEQLALALVDFVGLGTSVGLSAEAREGLISTWSMLGAVAADRGDEGGARRCMHASRRLAQRELERDPANLAVLDSLGVTTGNLASVAYRSGRAEDFLSFSRERIAISRRAAELAPSVRRQRLLARAEGNLAFALFRAGDRAEGQELYERATSRLRASLDEDPTRREVAESLADLCNRCGAQWTGSDNGRAVALLEESISLRRRLVADFPDAPRNRAGLGAALSNLNDALPAERGSARERERLDEAVAHTTAAVAAVPESPVFGRFLRTQLGKLARHHERARDAAGILACADRVERSLPPAAWQTWLTAARFVAMATPVVEGEQQPALRQRVLDLLARARAAGWSDPAHLERGFEAVRRDPGFEALLASLQNAAVPK